MKHLDTTKQRMITGGKDTAMVWCPGFLSDQCYGGYVDETYGWKNSHCSFTYHTAADYAVKYWVRWYGPGYSCVAYDIGQATQYA